MIIRTLLRHEVVRIGPLADAARQCCTATMPQACDSNKASETIWTERETVLH